MAHLALDGYFLKRKSDLTEEQSETADSEVEPIELPLPTRLGRQCGLKVQTINPAGLHNLKWFAANTSADILLVAETKVPEDKISEASAYFAKRCWKSVWSAASITQKNAVSGGTAVLARSFLDF